VVIQYTYIKRASTCKEVDLKFIGFSEDLGRQIWVCPLCSRRCGGYQSLTTHVYSAHKEYVVRVVLLKKSELKPKEVE
jgi:hypothetical protein